MNAAYQNHATDDQPSCPKCGGMMWDNRVGKKNPKAPDFKCREKSCEGVIWPPKHGAKPALVATPKPNAPQPYAIGNLPNDPADSYNQTLPTHAPVAVPPVLVKVHTQSVVYRECLKEAVTDALVVQQAGFIVQAADIVAIAATRFIAATR